MAVDTVPRYRICLIGSGGVGTIASVVLTKSKLAHVTAVLRSKYTYVSQNGWCVDSVDHGKLKGWKPHRVVGSVANAATDNSGQSVEYDYVVVSTKQLPDRSPVTDMISPVMTPGKTTVVLIQNGMGIEREVIKAWPGNVVMSSVSHIGSSVTEPNNVIQVGKDVSKMGPHYHDGVEDTESLRAAKEFVDMYNAGGASICELVNDIQLARWEKLLWNGTFNPICALTRLDVGNVQRSKTRETLIIPMMWEIWNIAKATGHPLPESIVNWMAYRLPDDCDYRPSMLIDIENGRPMELEVILGYPLELAREYGVAATTLDTVCKLLKAESWKIDEA